MRNFVFKCHITRWGEFRPIHLENGRRENGHRKGGMEVVPFREIQRNWNLIHAQDVPLNIYARALISYKNFMSTTSRSTAANSRESFSNVQYIISTESKYVFKNELRLL